MKNRSIEETILKNSNIDFNRLFGPRTGKKESNFSKQSLKIPLK